MKKIFTIAAIAVAMTTFAQNKFKPVAISGNFTYADPTQVGASFEYSSTEYAEKGKSGLINLSLGIMNYEAGDYKTTGGGFVVELGHRYYYGKNKQDLVGFWSANHLSYGNIKFDDSYYDFGTIGEKFTGTYSYFAFFAPEIGYKFKAGPIAIDPFVGAMWKIEIKGKGDIDNKNVDEWTVRAGIKVGYSF